VLGQALCHDKADPAWVLRSSSLPPMITSGPVRLEVDGAYGADGGAKPVSVQTAVISAVASRGGMWFDHFDVTGLAVKPWDAATKTI
jgi:hypothetical protein